MANYRVGDTVQLRTNEVGTLCSIENNYFQSECWYAIQLKQCDRLLFVQRRMIAKLIINNNNNMKKKINDDSANCTHIIKHNNRDINNEIQIACDDLVCGYFRNIEHSSLVFKRIKSNIRVSVELIDMCVQYYRPTFTKSENELFHAQLPFLVHTNDEEALRDLIFKNKLQLCTIPCYCTNGMNKIEKLWFDQSNLRKTKMLSELYEFASECGVNVAMFGEIIDMSLYDLCRDFTYQKYDDSANNNEYCDPNWMHLKLRYDLLWLAINSPHFVAPIIISDSIHEYWEEYIMDLFALFHSKDVNERIYLMKIIPKMYEKWPEMRQLIVEFIAIYFEEISSENITNCVGVTQVLQIIACDPTYYKIFKLFGHEGLNVFGEVLTRSVVIFANEDVDACLLTLHTLMRYWPSPCLQALMNAVVSVISVLNDHITTVDDGNWSYFMNKMEKSKDLFKLIVARMCECLMSGDNDVTLIAIAILEKDVMSTFIKQFVSEYIPEISQNLINIETRFSFEYIAQIQRIYS